MFSLLLIHEDPLFQTATQKLFENEEIELRIASSVNEVQAVLSWYEVDMIISNGSLPNGREILLNYVREHVVRRIILTNFPIQDETNKAISRNKIFRYLRKPWDHTE